jgi:LDH2 family malate/lactate/ureidoglycolate dehydrogenase
MQQMLPPGAAIDASGNSTQDPAAVQAGGGILPFGGHKGYALSLAIQAMCLLSVTGIEQPDDSGYLQITFDPELLVPAAQYKQVVAALIDSVRSAPHLPGIDEVRVPSERAFAQREKARLTGIALDRRLYDRITAL